MRWLGFLVYGLFLLCGTAFIIWWNAPPSPASAFFATRNLPKNHLLQPGDLSVAASGYLMRAVDVAKDAVVTPADILPFPDLKGDAGSSMVAFEVNRREVVEGGIDAGTAGAICPGAIPAKVVALFCGFGEGNCIALVNLSAASLTSLGSSAAAGASLVVAETCPPESADTDQEAGTPG